MTLTDEKLDKELKAGRLDRFYFLYGKETFLVKTRADRIVEKSVGDDPLDFNLIKLEGMTDTGAFSEYVEGLPVFAEMKAVVVHDPDIENMTAETLDGVMRVLRDIPDTTVIVFYTTSVEYNAKKLPAKLTKFLKEAEKIGTVCYFDTLTPARLAALAVKKAVNAGVVFEQSDAEYLTERVGGSMTVVSDETAKLITYCGKGGTITREIIDKLTAKHLDAKIYDLAQAINNGRRADAYRIVGEFFDGKNPPELIMSALSGAYVDFYRAKLAKNAGAGAQQTGEMFGYGGRSWVLSKNVFPYVGKLSIGFLREAVAILSEADLLLKSTSTDKQTIIEQAVTKLFISREHRL